MDITAFVLLLLENNPFVRNTRRRGSFNSGRQTLCVDPRKELLYWELECVYVSLWNSYSCNTILSVILICTHAARLWNGAQAHKKYRTGVALSRKSKQAVTIQCSYLVLDHICDLLCNGIETGAQMSRDLSGHHARVDNAHILATVQTQTTIDDTAQVTAHHRTCPDGMRDGVKAVPNPATPVCVRAALGVIGYTAESRDGLARREVGEGCGAEQTADEAGHRNLGEHVSFDAEWVDVDLGIVERVVVADMDCATAEGEERPGIYTYRVGIACVVEELGDRGYGMRIRICGLLSRRKPTNLSC